MSKGGTSAFQKPELEEFKYNYENLRQGKAPMYPGFLFHASDRNPRAEFSSPEPSGAAARSDSPDVLTPKQDRLRLAAATTQRPRGRDNDGFRMDEWATGMARLSRMDEHPGTSYNCDGDGSVVLGVTNQEGELTFSVAQAPMGRPLSTLLALRHGNRNGT